MDDDSGVLMGIFASIAITMAMAISWLYLLESDSADAAAADARESGQRADDLSHQFEKFTTPENSIYEEALVTYEENQLLQLRRIWRERFADEAWLPQRIYALRALLDTAGYDVPLLAGYENIKADALAMFPRHATIPVAKDTVRREVIQICRTAVSNGILARRSERGGEIVNGDYDVLSDRAALDEAIEGAYDPTLLKELSEERLREQRGRPAIHMLHINNLRELASMILQDLVKARVSFVAIEEAVAGKLLADRIRRDPEGTRGDGREKVLAVLKTRLLVMSETEDFLRGDQ
jgi:hypothetical protein